jgi:hypothetical protein
MAFSAREFGAQFAAIVRRLYAQNTVPAPGDATLNATGERLWAIATERGLPPPLAAHERGEPGGMTEEECSPLVARALAGAADPLLAEAVRQVIKACLYPEFKTCRDSFREVGADGRCKRQEFDRVRRRVSGAHCVDCPYWVTLTPEQHERFLAENWRAGAAEFAADRRVFLPEDFRALRQWVRRAAGKVCG